MSGADYLTFDLTVGWAQALARINPAMTLVYVSGAGTGGKAMGAQVKGRTQDAPLGLFRSAYMIRLGTLRAMHGGVSKTCWTRIVHAVFKPLRRSCRRSRRTRRSAARSWATRDDQRRAQGAPKRVLEVRDLRALGTP